MLTQLNPKALLLGLVTYLLVYGIYSVAMNMAMDSMPHIIFWTILTIGGLFAMSIGFVAGLMSGKAGWLHGLLIAIVGAVVISLVIQAIAPGLIDRYAFVGFVVVGGFLNTGAGWLGEFKNGTKRV